MLIRIGYEIGISCFQATPITTCLSVEDARRDEIVEETGPRTFPDVPLESYKDPFGNNCLRLVAPAGGVTLAYDAIMRNSGEPDPVAWDAIEHPVEDLPPECLPFLTGSRYCETDQLGDIAWRLFGNVPKGWERVQAICDYVNNRISFSYGYARNTRTALEAHEERVGVCRDFAHLAVAFCRCMNIPARYVNGYMGDIGVPADPAPMDFNAWLEVYLGGRWHTFDARHNTRRIGRIVVARGKDANDIPMLSTFGPHQLTTFKVWTYEETSSEVTETAPQNQVSLINPWFSEDWARHVQERSSPQM
ncbi:transglutaminase family protein [Rhizobium sp. CFBP 8762]|uniref:transglutaminase-like domain-containing protein n=1 Tax=Rhizobium sp. CFBP 8762 TaxID=2775279 RepID=UPI0017862428|nr:transglutaminase family protein [Rhizobium sp. CFBP 8762]MBD8555309.1 transglutaminase family protein [Rhizobium sp. CFBP 8762]